MSEELGEESLQTNKYYFLSVLRDTFRKYRSFGEEELVYFRSSCGSCERNLGKVVHVFEGPTTQHQFGFIPVKSQSGALSFHFCMSFLGRDGQPSANCYAFALDMALKLGEFRKRGLEE